MISRELVAPSPIPEAADAGAPAEPGASVGSRSLRPSISLSDLWVSAVVLVPAIALLQSRLWMLDLAYHVRAGELMLASHQVLRTDPFSFASGGSWLDQQWLAQVLFGAVFRLGGWFGLEALRAALGCLVAVLVYLACRDRGAERKRAAVLAIVATMAAFPGLILRPQLLGVVLFALVQWILVERDRRTRALLALPALFVVWANVHGTFPLGLVLIGIALIEELERRRPVRRLALVMAASALATGITPWGYGVWRYVVSLSTNPRIASWVQEWRPTTLRTLPGAVFIATVAMVIVVMARSRSVVRWSAVLALVLFFALGVSSIRGTYWWALVAAPILATVAPGRARAELERRSPLNAAFLGALILLLPLLAIPWIARPGTMLLDAPSDISARLEAVMRPGDRVLTAQRWGSWFDFELPADSVFVDSRIELYDERTWDDYLLVSRAGPGWQRVLDERGVDFVAAAPSQQAPLIHALRASDGWRLVYGSSEGALFERSRTATGT